MSLAYLQGLMGTDADGFFGPNTMRLAMDHFNLTPEQTAHFFGQCAHESGNFRAYSENLNYSAGALLAVFGKYFDEDSAEEYARNPEAIANIVYANRMGNGDTESGEGWKYRGRGAIQLTGKNNYTAFAEYMGDSEILDNPDVVAEKYSFDSAFFFFKENGLWDICKEVDEESITKLTKRINGGTHGLEDRIEKTFKFYEYVK